MNQKKKKTKSIVICVAVLAAVLGIAYRILLPETECYDDKDEFYK